MVTVKSERDAPLRRESVKLTLRETNTIWLLELPSTALLEDDPAAAELKLQIERYDYVSAQCVWFCMVAILVIIMYIAWNCRTPAPQKF
jgi:hypothetical protein